MIAGIHRSQEIFAIDMLTAIKLSLEHDSKHVVQLLRLYGIQGLHIVERIVSNMENMENLENSMN